MNEEVVKPVVAKRGRKKKEESVAASGQKFEFACLEIPKDCTMEQRAMLMRPFGAAGGELVAVVGMYDGTHVAYFMCEVK